MSLKSASEIGRVIEKNKKTLFIILLLFLGVLMILLSSSSTAEEPQPNDELAEYKRQLEEELSELCASVSGVGRCRVTVTFERGEESLYKGSQLIESKPPRVLGVTVVCKGADSDKVRGELTAMMSALFDIGSNRIAILKLN